MGRNRKHPLKITSVGAHRLICAVIEQAVDDYKGLLDTGRIVNSMVVRCRRKRRFSADYRNDSEVKELLDFLTKGALDEWLFIAGIPINPNLIREKLGITPRPLIVEGRPCAVENQEAGTED